MFECIKQILDFVIKLSIVSGIAFLAYFYLKILFLYKKIEKLNKAFEEERDSTRGQGRGIAEGIINGQIAELEKLKTKNRSARKRKTATTFKNTILKIIKTLNRLLRILIIYGLVFDGVQKRQLFLNSFPYSRF